MTAAMFVHVLAAMVLVGSLALAATSLSARDVRLGYRALLFAAIPSWIVMRVGAQWIFTEQGYDDVEEAPAWIDIGFATSEGSFLLIIAATICAGIGRRREGGGKLRTAALVLVAISLVAYLVAIWAMTTKPS